MIETPPVLHCANHPNVETTLRCNNCDKPICPKCAVLTPTGYRCRECVRGQQKTFDTAVWYDYLIGFAIALILSYIGSLFTRFVGFFTIFLAPIAGVAIAEAIRLAIRRHRSKSLYQMITFGAALGSLPLLLVYVLSIFRGSGSLFALLPLLWQGLYTFTVTTTVYYRLSGIQVR